MSLWGSLTGYLLDFPGFKGGTEENDPSTPSPSVRAWQPELKLVRALYGGFNALRDRTGYLLDFPGFKGGTEENDPSTPSPSVRAWQPELKLVRALYGGFNALRAERQQYLPQHPAEEEKDYFIRSMRPTFYNTFARTIRALTGIAFRQPPTPEGVPPALQTLNDDDIDNRGTNGDMFLRHTFLDALITGLTGIFVEMPTLDGENITRADELAAEIRPYWTLYSKDNIVSFRTVVEDGKLLLSQLVLKEVVQLPKGDYGVKLVEQYRSFKRLPAVAPATAEAVILSASSIPSIRISWTPGRRSWTSRT